MDTPTLVQNDVTGRIFAYQALSKPKIKEGLGPRLGVNPALNNEIIHQLRLNLQKKPLIKVEKYELQCLCRFLSADMVSSRLLFILDQLIIFKHHY